MRQRLLVILLGVLAIALPAHADLNLLEDFDALPAGGIDGVQSTAGGVWDTHTEATTYQAVATSPTGDPGDQVLASSGYSGGIRASHLDVGEPAIAPHNWIDDGETGTFFCRVYLPSNGRANHYLGLTQLAGELDTAAQAYYRAGVIIYNSATGEPHAMYLIDGGQGDKIADLPADTWINLWIVANNNTDSFDLYMTTETDTAEAGDLVADNLPFNETIPWTDALRGVNFRGGTSTTAIYIDHLYWDGDGENLTNPLSRVYAHDPSPADGAEEVPLDTMLSWTLGDDPYLTDVPNPGIYQQKVYFSRSASDPTLDLLATLDGATTSINPADYGKTLQLDASYAWRVDTWAWPNDPNFYPGQVWTFDAVPTAPVILAQPADAFADPGADVVFQVEVFNPLAGDATGLAYQWFKAGDPDVALADGPDFSGATSAALTVLDARMADEGDYYCEITLTANDATAQSNQANLTTKRIVAHWLFDGNYLDISGSGYDADPNGVPNYVDGIIDPVAGGATLLDGANGWATAGNWDPSIYSNQFSVVGWVRPDAGGANAAILSKRDGWNTSLMRWEFRITDGNRLQFMVNGGTINSAEQAAIGEWNHVAVVFDGNDPEGSRARVFLNGEPTRAGIRLNDGVDATMRIGHADEALAQMFIGAMDDLRVYNYALNELTIAEEYFQVTGNSPCVYAIDSNFDTNDDCKVDLVDFATFTADWLSCGLYPQCATP